MGPRLQRLAKQRTVMKAAAKKKMSNAAAKNTIAMKKSSVATSSSASSKSAGLLAKAGDQAAEGLIGNIKKHEQRTNMTGRNTDAHITALAAAWSLKHPGLTGVISAMKIYRQENQDKRAPGEAYNNKDWMGDVRERWCNN